MTTTLATVDLADEADVVGLRSLSTAVAAAYGLSAAAQARVAVAVTEAATEVLRRGGGTAALGVADGDPAFLEVVVADAALPAGRIDPSPAGPDQGQDLLLARRAAERCSIDTTPWGGSSVAMGWRLPAPAPPGEGGPSLAFDLRQGAPPGVLDLLRGEDRMLDAVLEALARSETALSRAQAQAQAEVRGLLAELEETNRGLIALHRELEEAREGEARLGAIVRSSDDAMCSVALDGTIATWNGGAERLFGYAEDEIVGRPVGLLLLDGARSEFAAAAERVRAGAHAVRYDAWRRRKDGSLFEVAVTLSAIRDPGERLIGYSAVLRDLTDQREAEEALAAARGRQEVYAERDRIARDLHDLVIQRLFAAGLALQGVSRRPDRVELQARLEQVVTDLDATIVEIRSTIFALGQDPADPQASGVRAQLLEVSAKAAEILGFTPSVRFTGPVDTAVPAEIRRHLVAVAREALSNVARHANASRVEVAVHAGSDVVLEVVDDGRGMGTGARRSGLANLEGRAKGLGGTLLVTSGSGAGTHVEWRVPVRPPDVATGVPRDGDPGEAGRPPEV